MSVEPSASFTAVPAWLPHGLQQAHCLGFDLKFSKEHLTNHFPNDCLMTGDEKELVRMIWGVLAGIGEE